MKIKIAHLFYDLLNLYGENGNVLALSHALNLQGIETEISYISLKDPLDLTDIDFIYMGAGTEQNQLLALEWLKKYCDELNQAFINNKFFLVTGNSIELFGDSIECDGVLTKALGMFCFETKRTSERFVSECIFNYDDINTKILGFENHQGQIYNINFPLFTVQKGFASNENTKTEGILKNNFYGTYLIGPLLVRNPDFLEFICRKLILSKDENFDFKPFDFNFEQKAYSNYMNKYYE